MGGEACVTVEISNFFTFQGGTDKTVTNGLAKTRNILMQHSNNKQQLQQQTTSSNNNKNQLRRNKKSKCHILKTACLNVSALTTSTKQEAIRKWVRDEEIDIFGLSETCFKEGSEPGNWIKGHRSYFNSVSSASYDTLTEHGRHAY